MKDIAEWFDLAEFEAFVGTLNYFMSYRIRTCEDNGLIITLDMSDAREEKELEEFIRDLLAIKQFCIQADSLRFFQNKKQVEIIFEKRALKGYAFAHEKE